LDGKDIFNMGGAYRAMLGYAPQQQKLYDDWTGDQFLWYMAALKGIPRRLAGEKIGQVLQLVNLTDVQYRKMKTYSGGMRQRILIAQSLLGDPQILILDEPTAGLDPSERAHIRDFIKTVAGEKIVLISTHVVSDIESIANEVILLKRGRVLRWDTTEHLIREIPGARGLEDVYLSLMGDTLQFTRHQTSVNGQRYQER
ncbi:MAG: ATP-binding cassette domain-containing protein, partial [Eubacteriales bacterium]|jgi:ABC-2 type transport system ATP-binding protein